MVMEQTYVAPAKVNLFLHLIDQNSDGYHLLESLFLFTNFGDVIKIEKSDQWQFHLTGRFAKTLEKLGGGDEDNLCMRAALTFFDHAKRLGVETISPMKIVLEKNLPIAAGIGGGSSDAAAVLLGLNDLWMVGLSRQKLAQFGLGLGADIPACVYQTPCFVEGVGEKITSVNGLKQYPILLVNPLTSLSTPAAFEAFHQLGGHFRQGLSRGWTDDFKANEQDFLKLQSNDLEPAACHLVPEITSLLKAIESQKDCWLSRMSGSGATCFGLFDSLAAAEEAKQRLSLIYPDYWLQEGVLHGA